MPGRTGTRGAARERRPPAPTSAEKARAKRLLGKLEELYPDADCELRHSNPLELLVATILSAQCTDERVNQVTRTLFRELPTVADYAAIERTALEEKIHSTGFYRNKARSLQGMAEALLERFDGQVPSSMEDLVTLPGVARKTANVVLGTAFQINAGVVVDTHVHRLARRLGLSAEDEPGKIERDLMARFPRPQWTFLGHALIQHGRRVCFARKPDCAGCTLRRSCPSSQ